MSKRAFRACGLAAITAALLVATAQAQQVPPADDPKALFEAGVNYLQEKGAPKYEEALELFRACYTKSGNFRALLPMGICELHLERDGDAIAHFQQYLSQGGADVSPELRAQAERDIATLSASLVRVTIRVEPVGASLVDERTPARGATIVNRYAVTEPTLTLGIHPGQHKFTITSDDRVPKEWSFEAAPGATLSAQFRLEATAPASPPPQESPVQAPRPPAPEQSKPQAVDITTGEYIGLAATGALLTGAVVTGLLGHSKHNELRDTNDMRHVDEANRLHDETQRLYVANGILLVGALVTGGATAYFHFSRKSEQPSGSKVSRLDHDGLGLCWQPELAAQGGRLTLSGEF
ncbi:MAG: hypothetical protein JW940_34160 [Polyangiaceae bacterium]|nr:hypothetical protein [Polyangiaceae bacterium]